MILKDYFRLSKLSLASRKQTSKSTVRGLSFGMILLIPVLFISIGLYGDLNSKVNKNSELLFANVTVAAERTGLDDNTTDEYAPTVGNIHAKNLINKLDNDIITYYEQIYSPFNIDNIMLDYSDNNLIKLFNYKIGSSSATDIYVNNNNDNNKSPFAAILDSGKITTDSFVPLKIKSKFNNVFLNNYNQGFTGDGKGQVILSEQFIKSLNLTNDEVYKNKITLSYIDAYSNSYIFNNRCVYIDNDNNPDNNSYDEIINSAYSGNINKCNLCYEYEVVGIISTEITEYAKTAFVNSRYEKSTNIMTNMMFFSEASLYTANGTTIEPVITMVESDEEENSSSALIATYLNNSTDFENLNKECMCLGANWYNSFNIYYGNNTILYPTEILYIDSTSYGELDRVVSEISKEVSFLFTDSGKMDIAYRYGSSLYSELFLIYTIFSYVIMFLLIMGGIIFFSAMVNLYNSIVHSIDTRKNYLGVMRAIGAKSNVIPKLYLAESITLFKRTFVWVTIFAGLLCTGIKIGLDYTFAYINNNGFLPYQISISAWYIPLSLLIGLVGLFILGFAFSYGCSRKIAKSPIMSILGDA